MSKYKYIDHNDRFSIYFVENSRYVTVPISDIEFDVIRRNVENVTFIKSNARFIIFRDGVETKDEFGYETSISIDIKIGNLVFMFSKTNDDWFILAYNYYVGKERVECSEVCYYKCDQLDGLIDCLNHVINLKKNV